MSGGAQAAGEIADRNIRLRDEEATFQRNQQAQLMQTNYANKLSIDRFHAEADRRLSDAPLFAAQKTAEEKSARLGQVAEVDAAQKVLVEKAQAENPGKTFTDREMSGMRTQAARNVGVISEKDAMNTDLRTDIAQLRADVENAKTEAAQRAAELRLENALLLQRLRNEGRATGGGGAAGGGADKRGETLTREQKAIEAQNNNANKAIGRLEKAAESRPYLARDPNTLRDPQQKADAVEWRAEYAKAKTKLSDSETQLADLAARANGLFDDHNDRRGGKPHDRIASPNTSAAPSAQATMNANRSSLFKVIR
jgi:hypothetical protein